MPNEAPHTQTILCRSCNSCHLDFFRLSSCRFGCPPLQLCSLSDPLALQRRLSSGLLETLYFSNLLYFPAGSLLPCTSSTLCFHMHRSHLPTLFVEFVRNELSSILPPMLESRMTIAVISIMQRSMRCHASGTCQSMRTCININALFMHLLLCSLTIYADGGCPALSQLFANYLLCLAEQTCQRRSVRWRGLATCTEIRQKPSLASRDPDISFDCRGVFHT